MDKSSLSILTFWEEKDFRSHKLFFQNYKATFKRKCSKYRKTYFTKVAKNHTSVNPFYLFKKQHSLYTPKHIVTECTSVQSYILFYTWFGISQHPHFPVDRRCIWNWKKENILVFVTYGIMLSDVTNIWRSKMSSYEAQMFNVHCTISRLGIETTYCIAAYET